MAKLSGTHAAIAQPVERILGKDEVASSNLASSSKKDTTQLGGVFFGFVGLNWRSGCRVPQQDSSVISHPMRDG